MATYCWWFAAAGLVIHTGVDKPLIVDMIGLCWVMWGVRGISASISQSRLLAQLVN